MIDTMESFSSVRHNGVPIMPRPSSEHDELTTDNIIKTRLREGDFCYYKNLDPRFANVRSCLECPLEEWETNTCRAFKKEGASKRKYFKSPKDIAREARNQGILNDFKSGMTSQAMAEKYGLKDSSNVRRIIRQGGLK